MDTHYKPLPFILAFIQNNEKKEITKNFSLDEVDLYKNVYAEKLTEFTNLSIYFSSDDTDSKMYMDGLDVLPDRYIKEDENGEVYISPSEHPVVLFNFNEDYYPLIPAYYRIMVLSQGKSYYSLVEVVTKHISNKQWELMKDGVDNEILGLAQDLIRRNLALGIPRIKSIPPKLLYQFSVIQKRRHSVTAAISDLHTKANHRIKKQYHMSPSDQATLIDEVTIRYKLFHPENLETLKIPIRNFDYDLPENKWLIRIVNKVTTILAQFMSSVENTTKHMNEEILRDEVFNYQLNTQAVIREKKKVLDILVGYWETSRKLNNAINIIKSASWYNEITDLITYGNIPHVMMADPRYREMYQLYRELLLEEYQISLDNAYSYQWKRTDKLYEIWGVIQMIKAISGDQLNFEPLSGWIFGENNLSNGQYLIPLLPPNTIMQFQKNDIKIHFTYDAVVPSRSAQTDSINNPLYTGELHNRPDGRLDVFKNNIFIGSIILDFKYSHPNSIWSSKINNSNRPKAMNQLHSYTHFKSKYLFGENKSSYYSSLKPVLEVWAIYPINVEKALKSPEPDKDHNIRLISLGTSSDNRILSSELENAINQLLERYKRIVHD